MIVTQIYVGGDVSKVYDNTKKKRLEKTKEKKETDKSKKICRMWCIKNQKLGQRDERKKRLEKDEA